MKKLSGKTGITAGIIIAIILAIYLFCTEKIDSSPYFESAYYSSSCARADSLDKVTFPSTDSLYAGFARVSITPVMNEDNTADGSFSEVPLAGYGSRKGKPSTGIHDSIFVKAVALKSGNLKLVFVSADLLIMPPNITDSVVVLLAKKGIRRDQLFFSATHSHSSLGAWGPGFIGEQFAGRENTGLEKWLASRISGSVTQAIADMRPASLQTGNFEAGIYTRNRLISKTGTKNDDFSFIYIEQTGKKKAVIGSFSAHATTLGDENMEISADYPGYWERRIENLIADVALFCAGSMGSQSPAGEGSGFVKAKNIGESLADSLIVHLRDIKTSTNPKLSAISLRISLPDYNLRLTTKVNLASFLSRKLMPLPKNVYLQAVRMNKMVWISTPSDFSGEFARQIKNNLSKEGFSSNITSFNGNYVGYIIPGRYFYMNEYESKIMGWFGPNMGEYTVDLIGRITKIVTKD